MGKAVSKQGFFSHFGEIFMYSWRSILSHPFVLTLLFLANVAFLFVFRYFQQPLLMKIDYTLQLLSSMFQAVVQAADAPSFVASAKQTTLSGILLNDALIKHLLSDLVLLFLLLAAAVYVVYTFFQSASVRTIGWMILDKKPYTLWSFIKLNSLWFAIYYVLRFIVFLLDTTFTFAFSGKNPLFSDLSILYTLIHIVLFYFVFISYTFVDEKKAWGAVKHSISVGLRHWRTFKYYAFNFIPFALFVIPYTHDKIIVPILNSLLVLGVVGNALQLILLFFIYALFVANVYTITYEVAKSD